MGREFVTRHYESMLTGAHACKYDLDSRRPLQSPNRILVRSSTAKRTFIRWEIRMKTFES